MNTQNSNSENTCPICYEKIENINKTHTECDHIFHSSCLIMHLSTNYNCPVCRKEFTTVENDNERFDYTENNDTDSEDEMTSVLFDSNSEFEDDYYMTLDEFCEKCKESNITIDEFITLIANEFFSSEVFVDNHQKNISFDVYNKLDDFFLHTESDNNSNLSNNNDDIIENIFENVDLEEHKCTHPILIETEENEEASDGEETKPMPRISSELESIDMNALPPPPPPTPHLHGQHQSQDIQYQKED